MGQFHSKVKKRMKTFDFDYDNLSGISLMYAIPISSFYSCIKDPIQQTYQLQLGAAVNIIDIPVYSDDSFSFSESQSVEDGGDLWNVSVSGIIPKRCQLTESLMNILERGEWLVLHRDANGTIVLSGTTDVPLKFTHARTTGSTGDMNGSQFTFSAKEPSPPVVISSLPTV